MNDNRKPEWVGECLLQNIYLSREVGLAGEIEDCRFRE
jgi:hypothetical protein